MTTSIGLNFIIDYEKNELTKREESNSVNFNTRKKKIEFIESLGQTKYEANGNPVKRTGVSLQNIIDLISCKHCQVICHREKNSWNNW